MIKKPDKKEPNKKSTEDYEHKSSDLISKNEIGRNREPFRKHFAYAKPSDMIKRLYITKNAGKKIN